MNTRTVAPFHIIGIGIRTTNRNHRSASDINFLWNTFLSQKVRDKIPNRVDKAIYCVYTDYENDHTQPFTAILGCRVDNLDEVPEGLTARSFGTSNYNVFTAKGRVTDGIVFREWKKIHESDIDRSYRADFEVYDDRAQNPAYSEIDIFIGVNEYKLAG